MDSLSKQMYMSKIPEILQDNKNFNVFMELAVSEFNLDLANIESFTDLIDPDKVPSQFIEALGSVVGFERCLSADDEFNREILTRIQSIYSQRGTDKSILMAANHGSNEGWVGGQIFVPGYVIETEEARIVFTTDKIFTHCRSKHSGGDVFTDNSIYRPGVILITVPFLDAKIREAINENIPAGVKYYILIENRFLPNPGEEGTFGELSVFKYFTVVAITEDEKLGLVQELADEEFEFSLEVVSSRDDALIFSDYNMGGRKRSGRQLIFVLDDLEFFMGTSALGMTLLRGGFDTLEEVITSETGEILDVVSKTGSEHLHHDLSEEVVEIFSRSQSTITAIRSEGTSLRSGLNNMSGYETAVIDLRVFMGEVYPGDMLHVVGDLENIRPIDLEQVEYMGDMDIETLVNVV